MTRAVEARVSLGALRHNLNSVKTRTTNAKVIAIIKADGYGHGMVAVAQALVAADAFGVACVEEAVILREAGVTKKILLLAGFFDVTELPLIDRYELDCVVHHPYQVGLLQEARLSQPINIWLKIDTGMHRLGIAPSAVQSTYAALVASPNVKQPLRWMSHFASADDLMSGQTAEQLTLFEQLTSVLPGEQSLANSAAILAWPQSHRHWVRPGVMLYGVSPFAQRVGAEFDLRPAMTLTSRIMAINHYPPGAAIGYGATWICPETMPVGVVAIGYGDGYPRHAKVGTPVLIHGRRALIVGRVSMDSICIDLRGHPEALIGDEVILWGEGLPVEEVAQSAGTIPYELLCKVTPRTRFRYTV